MTGQPADLVRRGRNRRRSRVRMVFAHTAVVPAAPDLVFALTQDYERRLTWDPFLPQRACSSAASTAPAVGGARLVRRRAARYRHGNRMTWCSRRRASPP